jgi:hypothetical protein
MLTHHERPSMLQAVFWLSHYGASKFARVKAKMHALSAVSLNSFIDFNHSFSLNHILRRGLDPQILEACCLSARRQPSIHLAERR